MTQQTKLWWLLAAIVTLPIAAQSDGPDKSPYKSAFITANGVRLHYLDWGGQGETMLFLHGIGDTSHGFDDFAPEFTNQFRVLGLTRRGHGESDIPDTGYDTATRVEDIRQFLDALNISRAILVGFSAAGGELTMFAGKYPERTIKVVYLDAIFDREGLVAMRKRGAPPELSPPETNRLDTRRRRALALMAENEAQPDYKQINSPVLAFVVVGVPASMIEHFKTLPEPRRKVIDEFLRERDQVKEKETERFRQELPSARVVTFTNANHACFIDKKDDVLREMRKFLAK